MSYLVGKKGASSIFKSSFKATPGQTSVSFAETLNPNTLSVHRNGVLLYKDDYSVSGNTLTFVNPLSADDEIVIENVGAGATLAVPSSVNASNVVSGSDTLNGVYGSGMVGSATYAQLRAYTGDATRLNLADGGVAVRRGNAPDNGGTVWKDAANRSWERIITGGVVHIDWFLPEGFNHESDSCHNAANAAWEFCLQNGFNLYHGPRKYKIVAEQSFPYGRVNGLTPTELLDCKGIKIFGAGKDTILQTASVSGADVIQLNGASNLEICDMSITSTISGTDYGSNGISVTGGYDNITLSNIWLSNLAFVDKGTYIDGGKALSIQTPVSGQTLKCGKISAKNIVANGCVYGLGIEVDMVAASSMPTSIDVDIVAQNCREGIVLSAGEATGPISPDWQSGIKIKATLIDCMNDIYLSRSHGVDIDCVVVTTKNSNDRLLSPTGNKWKSTDTTDSVIGLKCAYAHNSRIKIHGNKGSCAYKALIGGATSGSSGLTSATWRSRIDISLSGTSSNSDFGAVDSGGNVTSNCIFVVSGDMGVPDIAHYAPSRNNLVVHGNSSMLSELLVQGSIKFTYADGKTSYAEIGYDDESVTVKQTVGSSAEVRPFRVLKNTGTNLLYVRNDGALGLSMDTATSVSTVVRTVSVYDPVSGAFIGYMPVYSTKT